MRSSLHISTDSLPSLMPAPDRRASSRMVSVGLSVMASLALGALVLRIGGLPTKWALVILGGLLLLAVAALIRPALRRALEIGLMLSFAANIDYHIANDPTHLVAPTGIPISVTGLLACLLGGWWLIERVGRPTGQPLCAGLAFPVIGLWATAILSIVGAPAPRFGLYALVNLATFTLLFLYLANGVSTRDHLRFLLGWLIVAIGVTSVAAMAQHALDRTSLLAALGMLSDDRLETLASSDLVRAGGLLGSSNRLAWGLAQFLPLLLALFLCSRSGYRKTFLVAGLGAGVVALISTYSRGGWLAFAVALLVVLVLTATRQMRALKKGWLGKLTISVVFLAVLAAPLYGNIYTRLTEDDRGSARARLYMMQVASRIIEDNPVFGVGLGNYENVMHRYDRGPKWVHQDFPWPVHNIYLHITAEIGLLGGFCYVLLALLALWQGVRAMRAPDPFVRAAAIGLVAGLIAYLIVGMKELGSLGTGRFFWLAVGLLAATRRISERAEEGKRPTHSSGCLPVATLSRSRTV